MAGFALFLLICALPALAYATSSAWPLGALALLWLATPTRGSCTCSKGGIDPWCVLHGAWAKRGRG